MCEGFSPFSESRRMRESGELPVRREMPLSTIRAVLEERALLGLREARCCQTRCASRLLLP